MDINIRIKNIVFDVGKVLIDYDPQYVVDQLLPNSPHKQAYLDYILNNPFWLELDRGTYSHEEAPDALINELGHIPSYREDVKILLDNYIYHLSPMPESKALFLALKQNYSIYILSNFQTKPFEKLLELQPFIQKADGIVVSANIKMLKPNPEIYEYLLNTYDLKPEETLFFDDMPENIQGAKNMGIHGIVFKSTEQTIDELKSYNIEIPILYKTH